MGIRGGKKKVGSGGHTTGSGRRVEETDIDETIEKKKFTAGQSGETTFERFQMNWVPCPLIGMPMEC